MIPVLVKPIKIYWELEEHYILEVVDKAAGEKPIIVTEHQFKELEKRGLLREK